MATITARQGQSTGTSSESGTPSGAPSTSDRDSTSSTTSTSAGLTTTPSDAASTDTAITTTSLNPSSTTDAPFFPSPPPAADAGTNNGNLRSTKNVVEVALVIAAVVVVFALILWRIICLRRARRSIRDFFSCNPQPDAPPRPRAVPRTTGLPRTNSPPAHAVYDYLTMPVPLLLGEHQRRRHGRRTRAGDVDAGGRRGSVAHPDDPNEFLPEYDDKDVLPKYQDLERGNAGRFPNGSGSTSDRIPLVTRMQLASNATLQDAQRPPSSAGSHDEHEHVPRYDSNPSI